MVKKLLPIIAVAAGLILTGCNKTPTTSSAQPGPSTTSELPHDGKTAETAFTIDEMLEEMKDYEQGQWSAKEYFITGVFATGTTFNDKYTSWSGYTVGHEDKTEKPFQLYSVGTDVPEYGTKYGANGCLDGATFICKGFVTAYGKDGAISKYEMAFDSKKGTPKIVSLSGAKEKEEAGEVAGDKTIAEALAVINALSDGGTTKDKYNVVGYITAVTGEWTGEYKNITFTMGDTASQTENLFTVFRFSCTQDVANTLTAGKKVRVKATLKKYVKDGAVTPETDKIDSVTVIA